MEEDAVSDEEDDIGEKILENVFQSYSSNYGMLTIYDLNRYFISYFKCLYS